MIQYICDFCDKRVLDDEVVILSFKESGKKKTLHMHKKCLSGWILATSSDASKDVPIVANDFEPEVKQTEKLSELFAGDDYDSKEVTEVEETKEDNQPTNVEESTAEQVVVEQGQEIKTETEKMSSSNSPTESDIAKPVKVKPKALMPKAEDTKEDVIEGKDNIRAINEIVIGPDCVQQTCYTIDEDPQIYSPNKKYKGDFIDVQRVLLSWYIQNDIKVGLRFTSLNYAQAYQWVKKFAKPSLAKLFKHANVSESIDGTRYDVKRVCNLFVNGKSIDWIAEDCSYPRDVVLTIINKYSGVKIG